MLLSGASDFAGFSRLPPLLQGNDATLDEVMAWFRLFGRLAVIYLLIFKTLDMQIRIIIIT